MIRPAHTFLFCLVQGGTAGAAAAVAAGDGLLDKAIVGGSVVGLVVAYTVWMTRHYTAVLDKRDALMADLVKNSNATIGSATEQFAATVAACDARTADLLREQRAHQEARENKLIEVLEKTRTPR
jgi:hypothetical protein